MAGRHHLGDGQIMTLGVIAMAFFALTVVAGWAIGVGPEVSDPPLPPDSTEGSLAPGVQGVLPDAVRESSGVAVSAHDPSLFWTHNDGPDRRLFLVQRSGALAGEVSLVGVEPEDLEDIDVGPCPGWMEGSSCLYVADTGDNDRVRDTYAVLIAVEPEPGPGGAGLPARLPAHEVRYRYPDQSRDAEAIAVAPGGDVFVVTKGQEGAAEMFRVPLTESREVVDAVAVRRLPISVDERAGRITAAALDATGDWLAVRSDSRLFIFAWGQWDTAHAECDLSGSGQGEGVDFLAEELFILTREGRPAPIEIVPCP